MTNIEKRLYQVSELASETRQLLEASYPGVWVEGEISNLAAPASGHLYFSIKDDKAQLRCAFFRNRMNRLQIRPENGMRVRITAQVSLYENRGDFQLIVSQLEDAGVGNLQLQFEQLKKKLASEGLFNSEHKKSLPKFPKVIGVITSATGAVIEDIISTCQRRYPLAQIKLYPVQVQGTTAARQIAQTIDQADKNNQCDVMIVGRGGGSLEDLWAFNEEVVARAIYQCHTPIISAVGHETDFTIADFVADVRAPTPTAAAEMATADQAQLLHQFSQYEKRLLRAIKSAMIQKIQHADMLARRLVHPTARLKRWQQHNDQLRQRMQRVIKHRLEQQQSKAQHFARILKTYEPSQTLSKHRQELTQLTQRLTDLLDFRLKAQAQRLTTATEKMIALSPQSTLQRGYAIVTTSFNQAIVRSQTQVEPKQAINIKLADGDFAATVDE